MWERQRVIEKPLFLLSRQMGNGAELCEHITPSGHNLAWQRETRLTSGFSTQLMITPTPCRSGLSLSCSQSKGSFFILSCWKQNQCFGGGINLTVKLFQVGFRAPLCERQVVRFKKRKHPGIDPWAGWLAWLQWQLQSKNVVARLPFPTRTNHVELCRKQPVAALPPAATLHVSVWSLFVTVMSISFTQPTWKHEPDMIRCFWWRTNLIKVCFEVESESKVKPVGLFSLSLSLLIKCFQI